MLPTNFRIVSATFNNFNCQALLKYENYKQVTIKKRNYYLLTRQEELIQKRIQFAAEFTNFRTALGN